MSKKKLREKVTPIFEELCNKLNSSKVRPIGNTCEIEWEIFEGGANRIELYVDEENNEPILYPYAKILFPRVLEFLEEITKSDFFAEKTPIFSRNFGHLNREVTLMKIPLGDSPEPATVADFLSKEIEDYILPHWTEVSDPESYIRLLSDPGSLLGDRFTSYISVGFYCLKEDFEGARFLFQKFEKKLRYGYKSESERLAVFLNGK